MLRDLFKGEGRVHITEGDALKVLSPYSENLAEDFVLAGNLPYNISSAIMILATTLTRPPIGEVFLLQKEMAEHVSAAVGSKLYSSLSVFLQSFWSLKRIAKVPAEAFFPKPNVSSLAVSLTPKSLLKTMSSKERTLYLGLCRELFRSRRKTLFSNARACHMPYSKERLLEAFKDAGIDPSRRAQELDPDQFLTLFHKARL